MILTDQGPLNAAPQMSEVEGRDGRYPAPSAVAAPLTERDLIDHLIYASYIYNRKRSPEISPEWWAKILPNVPEMERKFQRELADLAAPALSPSSRAGNAAAVGQQGDMK